MQLPDLPQSEQVIIEMTNAFRREQKLAPVKPNAALTAAARAFARYLAETGRFGHTVDGRQPADRTKAAGYKHCIVAENLAMNQDSRGFETRALAGQAVTGWQNSPPHRAAMLNPHVTEIGVGIVRAPDAAPKFLSVQLFGRPDSLKYSFRVENLSEVTVRYTFRGEPIDVPKRSSVTQTECVGDVLTFRSIDGRFTPTDGAVYRLTGSGTGLKVESVGGAINPDAVQSGKSR